MVPANGSRQPYIPSKHDKGLFILRSVVCYYCIWMHIYSYSDNGDGLMRVGFCILCTLAERDSVYQMKESE
jgi:hypothetical protein